MSSTVGSPTNTGWKRRASAASFSMCLRYSSSVVAPTQCSSPRASAGFSMLEASIAPSALPAPTSVCSSSMKRMISPSAGGDLRQHGLQPLLELAADTSRRRPARRGRAPSASCPSALSGTSPLTMRSARPSTMAVLPTPGSPISTGLFLVRRAQHLDGAADLLVAADHRVELAVARRLRSGRGRISSARRSRSRPTRESAVRPLRSSCDRPSRAPAA